MSGAERPETSQAPVPRWDGGGWPTTRQRAWWGAMLVLIGVVWLLLALEVPVAWDLVLPIALVVVGVLVLIVGRRARGDGLISLGILITFVAVLVAFVPGPLSLSAGEREHRYTTLASLDEDRVLGAGRMTVDLREVPFPDGATHVSAGVTFGEMVVLVPATVTVTGSADVGMGEISAFGRTDGGVGRSRTFDEAGTDDGPVVELELGVGFGRIEVRR